MSWWQLVPGSQRAEHRIAVAPSVLSADFSRLSEEIAEVERAGADLIHLDVMDGHFVPNLTFGPLIVDAIRRLSRLPLDVHLMIESPDRFLERFLESGADIVTIHVEASNDVERDLEFIKQRGKKCGLSLNPDAPIERVKPFLETIDLLLVMSVFPGFGGQTFIEGVLRKIAFARELREKGGFSYAIEIDGGINGETAKSAREAGVDILVTGTAVFKSPDYRRAIREIRGPDS